MYARAARAAGLEVTTWFDDGPFPRADLCHAFNIDRPLELYPKMVEARRRGIPFVLSTIHHPHEWLARFRRVQPPTGVVGRLLYRSPFGRSVAATERAKEVAMLVLQRRLAHLGDVMRGWSARVRWLLANAARVVVLSSGEAASLERDFGYRVSAAQALLVPNWVEDIDDVSDATASPFATLPEAPVIVVGRIEPRKNSVRICRLAGVARRHVVFIGRPHPSEGAFVEAFTRAVQASAFAHWTPGVPRSDMAPFYRHASFLLNASLVEVSPLVDIEALELGCPVVTTRYAVHHDFLPSHTPTCDPYDDEDIARCLEWRPGRLPRLRQVDGAQCRRDLVETYRVLMG